MEPSAASAQPLVRKPSARYVHTPAAQPGNPRCRLESLLCEWSVLGPTARPWPGWRHSRGAQQRTCFPSNRHSSGSRMASPMSSAFSRSYSSGLAKPVSPQPPGAIRGPDNAFLENPPFGTFSDKPRFTRHGTDMRDPDVLLVRRRQLVPLPWPAMACHRRRRLPTGGRNASRDTMHASLLCSENHDIQTVSN